MTHCPDSVDVTLDWCRTACSYAAQVHRELGKHVEAFLDLRRLSAVAPEWPGLLQLLEEAATLSLGQRTSKRSPAVQLCPSYCWQNCFQGASVRALR